jgi:hypothetical protein
MADAAAAAVDLILARRAWAVVARDNNRDDLIVLSAAHPPRGNIATASSLHPPPPPSRSLHTVHCRLLHAVSARTSPPPLSPQPPPCERTKASILAKKATAFATAIAPLLTRGTLLGSHTPPTAPPSPPPTTAIPAKSAERGGQGSHLCESDRSPPRGTSLPPRRQRESCRDDSRSPAAPLSHAPLAPCRGHADHVPWGRLPARNEVINQDGQHVVGRWRMLPSSPLQFSQPANPPILLFARLIFQSRSYKFSTPNFPLTKNGRTNDPVYYCVCTTSPPIPRFFRRGIRAPPQGHTMSIVEIRQWSYFQNNLNVCHTNILYSNPRYHSSCRN